MREEVFVIQLKRVYEKPEPNDGIRFLVERLWPRGIRKAGFEMDAWQKDAGPSDRLRKWFAHDPARWAEFQRRYFAELKAAGSLGTDFARRQARQSHATLQLP